MYVLANFLGVLLSITSAIIIAIVSSEPGRLIDARKYNLSTISGQGDFAYAIQKSNLNLTTSLFVEAFFSLLAVFFILTLAKTVQLTKFRSSVVALLTGDNAHDHSAPAARHNVQATTSNRSQARRR